MKKYFVLIAVVCSILFSCEPEPQLPSVGFTFTFSKAIT